MGTDNDLTAEQILAMARHPEDVIEGNSRAVRELEQATQRLNEAIAAEEKAMTGLAATAREDGERFRLGLLAYADAVQMTNAARAAANETLERLRPLARAAEALDQAFNIILTTESN